MESALKGDSERGRKKRERMLWRDRDTPAPPRRHGRAERIVFLQPAQVFVVYDLDLL